MLASHIFNGYIGSHLCYHLSREGILDLFKDKDTLNKSEINDANFSGTRLENVRLIIDYAVKFGIFHEDDEQYRLTELGSDIEKNIGFFTWAVGGYGNFLRNFTDISKEKEMTMSSMIDGANVALGSRQANKQFMWDIIIEELSSLQTRSFADLGCGAAGALIDICRKFDGVTGTGIDISTKAIDSARINIEKNNLKGRIEVVNQNVLDAIDSPYLIDKFSRVDTVLSFMMMHDLFNIKDPVEILKKLQSTFPNAKTFIIADTFLSEEKSLKIDTPIFTYGFEYVHHFMKIKIFHKEQYLRFFSAAGFSVERVTYLNVPNTYLFVLHRDFA
ncbi:class I SAM-dependent methyltransferase [Pantoea agglomerans]|uniref:methyltransferase domain-containing protein n=1 Tax=Enterobacter agglomerans TaxID=549 RepID=UPI003C7BDD76